MTVNTKYGKEPLSIELISESMFIQKLEYIHYNPVSAGLCKVPEEYYYSSAKFYFDGTDNFRMLTHYFLEIRFGS
ncbi:MAG: hypothetical protein ABIO55_14415 [Ginsengibacter sp.]